MNGKEVSIQSVVLSQTIYWPGSGQLNTVPGPLKGVLEQGFLSLERPDHTKVYVSASIINEIVEVPEEQAGIEPPSEPPPSEEPQPEGPNVEPRPAPQPTNPDGESPVSDPIPPTADENDAAADEGGGLPNYLLPPTQQKPGRRGNKKGE
jgi:hypothetical protein